MRARQKYQICQIVLLRASRAIIVFVKKVQFLNYSERQQVDKPVVIVVSCATYLFSILLIKILTSD